MLQKYKMIVLKLSLFAVGSDVIQASVLVLPSLESRQKIDLVSHSLACREVEAKPISCVSRCAADCSGVSVTGNGQEWKQQRVK